MDSQNIDRILLSKKMGRIITHIANKHSIDVQKATEMVLESHIYQLIEKPQTAYWLKGDVELSKMIEKELAI